MFKLLRSKKGFTLIEMVITLVVLSILMATTLGMIDAGGRVYTASYARDVDKGIGDNVFESIESALRYCTHLEIKDTNVTNPKETGKYSQGFYIDETESNTNSGVLNYVKTDESTGTKSDEAFYPETYYSQRTVRYSVKKVGENNKHVELTLDVIREGKSVYTRSAVITCVNLALLTGISNSNEITDTSTSEYNQYLSFNTDELLLTSDSNGYQITNQAKKLMAKYNEIQNWYVAEMTSIENTFEGVVGNATSTTSYILKSTYDSANSARLLGFTQTKKEAQDKIYDLLGFTPTASGLDSDDYMYGVVATKEELFFALLLQNYDTDKDGTITESEFPHYSDPDSFFSGTIFSYKNGGTKVSDDLVQCVYYVENTSNYDALATTSNGKIYTAQAQDVLTQVPFVSADSGASSLANDYQKNTKTYSKTGYTNIQDLADQGICTISKKSEGWLYAYWSVTITVKPNKTIPAGNYYYMDTADIYYDLGLWNYRYSPTWFTLSYDVVGNNASNTIFFRYYKDDSNHRFTLDFNQISTSHTYYYKPHYWALVPTAAGETGTVGQTDVTYYQFSAHQFTDLMTYGVQYSSWYGTSSKGLLNNAIKWLANIFSGGQAASAVTLNVANASKSLGRTGTYSVNSISNSVHSYNAALLCYHDTRGTWYYQPNSSTSLSAVINGSSLLSDTTSPKSYDLAGSSSSTLMNDINSNTVSSTGVFNMNTTSSTVWTPLPLPSK